MCYNMILTILPNFIFCLVFLLTRDFSLIQMQVNQCSCNYTSHMLDLHFSALEIFIIVTSVQARCQSGLHWIHMMLHLRHAFLIAHLISYLNQLYNIWITKHCSFASNMSKRFKFPFPVWLWLVLADLASWIIIFQLKPDLVAWTGKTWFRLTKVPVDPGQAYPGFSRMQPNELQARRWAAGAPMN